MYNNFEVNQVVQLVQEVNIVINMKIFKLALLIATIKHIFHRVNRVKKRVLQKFE
jgi:hypothetical protein